MISPRDVHELQQRYLALWFGYALSATQLCVLACFWPAPVVRAMSDLCWQGRVAQPQAPQPDVSITRPPRRERRALKLVAAA